MIVGGAMLEFSRVQTHHNGRRQWQFAMNAHDRTPSGLKMMSDQITLIQNAKKCLIRHFEIFLSKKILAENLIYENFPDFHQYI